MGLAGRYSTKVLKWSAFGIGCENLTTAGSSGRGISRAQQTVANCVHEVLGLNLDKESGFGGGR